MEHILVKIAEALDTVGLQARIVVGRYNYYENDNKPEIVVDMLDMITIGYFTRDAIDNVALMQATLILEFRGENAGTNLSNYLCFRNTNNFYESVDGVEIFLNSNITTLRDKKGTQFFQRYVLSVPCRFFLHAERIQNYISNIGKVHLFKED